eukprot:7186043-Ditylum_brightwellii.AAC.1
MAAEAAEEVAAAVSSEMEVAAVLAERETVLLSPAFFFVILGLVVFGGAGHVIRPALPRKCNGGVAAASGVVVAVAVAVAVTVVVSEVGREIVRLSPPFLACPILFGG